MGQMDQRNWSFLSQTDILDVGPFWIFAPTACPRTGLYQPKLSFHDGTEPIPAQSRSPRVLETRRSSWGRPSEFGPFLHKTDILDV